MNLITFYSYPVNQGSVNYLQTLESYDGETFSLTVRSTDQASSYYVAFTGSIQNIRQDIFYVRDNDYLDLTDQYGEDYIDQSMILEEVSDEFSYSFRQSQSNHTRKFFIITYNDRYTEVELNGEVTVTELPFPQKERER